MEYFNSKHYCSTFFLHLSVFFPVDSKDLEACATGFVPYLNLQRLTAPMPYSLASDAK